MSPNIFGARATRDEALREEPLKRFLEDIEGPVPAEAEGFRVRGLLVPGLTLLVVGEDSCGVGRKDKGPWAYKSTGDPIPTAKTQVSPSASLLRFSNMALYTFSNLRIPVVSTKNAKRCYAMRQLAYIPTK